jgi:thioredoxin-like negative regulator of GroEL
MHVETDWKAEVERLAGKSEMHAQHVEAARQHATDPNDWEAVYTLAVQRIQMIGDR